MRKHYQIILELAKKPFIPAFAVKQYRKFPCDYRKRISELRKMGLIEKLDNAVIDGHVYSVFKTTKKGLTELMRDVSM